VAKKPRARKPVAKRKPISAKTRAADERLRASLRHADLKAFDRVLDRAIKHSPG
jgi:hypothetical protein